jgi:hypothetical protein
MSQSRAQKVQEIMDETKFQFAYKIFKLADFSSETAPLQKHSLNGNNKDFHDTDFFPMVQFVRSKRLYYVVLKQTIEYSYMEIGGKAQPLSLLETINQYMVDDSTA